MASRLVRKSAASWRRAFTANSTKKVTNDFLLRVAAVREFSTSPAVVDSNSWAAESLTRNGEVLPAGKELPFIDVSEELLHAAPDHVKDMADEALSLNTLEAHVFWKHLQTRMGVPDEVIYGGLGGGGGGGGGDGEAAAEEVVAVKEAWDLHLKAVDPKSKIKMIKEVRAITGLGLKEAKDLVEKAPCLVKAGLSKAEAEELAAKLKEVGGEAEIL